MESTLQMLKQLFQLKNTPNASLWQQHKKTMLLCSLIGSLQACGGGGGNSSVTTPTIPKSYEFSLTSTLTNKCGEKLPFVDVELFIQNSKWDVVEKLQPNANGVFSFTSDSELINYTLAAKTQQSGKVEGLELVSFHQVKATTAAVYQAQHSEIIDNTNCECVTKNVSLQHATITNINQETSSASYSDVTFIDSRNTIFNDVEVCRITGSNWPLHSFSIVGKDNNNDVIGSGAFIEEVFGNDIWEVSAFESSTTEFLKDNHQAFSNEQLINGNSHFFTDVKESDTSVQIFRKHDNVDLFRSEAEYTFEERPNLNEYLRTSSKQIITSEIYQDSLLVEAEIIVPEAFKDDKSMNVIAIKSDGSYDFTTLADFPMAIITIDFQSVNPATNTQMLVNWVTYGPIEGLVPIKVTFPGYESLISDQTHFRIDSEVIQSVSSNTYGDYVSYFQNHVNTSFENNLKSYQIIVD
jgi:hypothetical protein